MESCTTHEHHNLLEIMVPTLDQTHHGQTGFVFCNSVSSLGVLHLLRFQTLAYDTVNTLISLTVPTRITGANKCLSRTPRHILLRISVATWQFSCIISLLSHKRTAADSWNNFKQSRFIKHCDCDKPGPLLSCPWGITAAYCFSSDCNLPLPTGPSTLSVFTCSTRARQKVKQQQAAENNLLWKNSLNLSHSCFLNRVQPLKYFTCK